MAVVETETHGQILVVRMNRPDRLNALNHEMRTDLSKVWNEFRESTALEVAIFTGAGRGFCAGEDMKESLKDGAPGGRGPKIEDPFMSGKLEKPVIAAINGFAMGGGFMLVHLAKEKRTVAIDYREIAPGKATRDMYLDAKGDVTRGSLDGAKAAGIPGTVAGMELAHKTFASQMGGTARRGVNARGRRTGGGPARWRASRDVFV
mgnify:CR=1 FL=1